MTVASVTSSSKRIGRQAGLVASLITVLSAYYLANAQIMLGHYDLGWHLAAGDLIRAKGAIPLHDPWSFTAGAKQWFNLSWGWDVFASVLFQYTHFSGLLLMVAVCGAAIAGILVTICLRRGASAMAACLAVLFACLLYPSFPAYSNIYLSASPNTATMLFAVLFYGICLGRSRWLLLLPVVMLFWANLHGGFLIGIFLIGFFGAFALLKRDWAALRLYLLAGAGCFAATFVTPLGWHIYQGATATVGNHVQGYISEWLPYYSNFHWPGSLSGLIYILVFAGLEARAGKNGPLEARLLSWLFLALGLYQFRYLAFFFLFSAPSMALHFDRELPAHWHAPRVQDFAVFIGLLTACALPLLFLRAEPTLGLPALMTEADARYLTSHFPKARLLNHWNLGGDLIFYTRGAVPLFIDGRAATAYSDAVLGDYLPLGRQQVNEADWNAVLTKYHIDAVLWIRAHEELRRLLVGKQGWKEIYDGTNTSLYVKP